MLSLTSFQIIIYTMKALNIWGSRATNADILSVKRGLASAKDSHLRKGVDSKKKGKVTPVSSAGPRASSVAKRRAGSSRA